MSDQDSEDGKDEKKVRKSKVADYVVEESEHSDLYGRRDKTKKALFKLDVAMQSTDDICQMYLQGYSLLEIGKKVRLSLSVVREVIDASRTIWLERHNQSLSDLVAEQIAKIDRVESRAWESYEESRKNHLEKQESTGSNDKGAFSSTKITKRRQSGSADFLNVVLNCVRQRSALLGLNKRADDDIMHQNSMLVVVNSPEEARAIHDYQQFQKMVDGTVVEKDDGEPVSDSPAPNTDSGA